MPMKFRSVVSDLCLFNSKNVTGLEMLQCNATKLGFQLQGFPLALKASVKTDGRVEIVGHSVA